MPFRPSGTKRKIDLNVDIGEGFPYDKQLLEFATSANVCCGAHAGSMELLQETLEHCRSAGVRIGAHPGYPDRRSMGRVPIDRAHEKEYLDSIFSQLRWFMAYGSPAYLKPHGAFYNDTAVQLTRNWNLDEEGVADYRTGGIYLSRFPGVHSLQMILRVYRLPLMGLKGTAHEAVSSRTKQPLIREGFADRAYKNDGTLVPRSVPGAVLEHPESIRRQTLRLLPQVDSICLHGDTPGCLEFAELVKRTIVDAGYEVGH